MEKKVRLIGSEETFDALGLHEPVVGIVMGEKPLLVRLIGQPLTHVKWPGSYEVLGRRCTCHDYCTMVMHGDCEISCTCGMW